MAFAKKREIELALNQTFEGANKLVLREIENRGITERDEIKEVYDEFATLFEEEGDIAIAKQLRIKGKAAGTVANVAELSRLAPVAERIVVHEHLYPPEHPWHNGVPGVAAEPNFCRNCAAGIIHGGGAADPVNQARINRNRRDLCSLGKLVCSEREVAAIRNAEVARLAGRSNAQIAMNAEQNRKARIARQEADYEKSKKKNGNTDNEDEENENEEEENEEEENEEEENGENEENGGNGFPSYDPSKFKRKRKTARKNNRSNRSSRSRKHRSRKNRRSK